MTWSDLHPGARAALVALGCLVLLLVVWSFVVGPLRARQSTLASQADSAESRLEQMERQIEAVPPASQAELAAWQSSSDSLMSQLPPESDLPLFIEALVRLSEAQGVEAFVDGGGAVDVSAGQTGASRTEQVIGAIPGTRRVPLNVSAFGDYAAISGFIAQIGRLGWVTEIGSVELQRSFPEIAAELQVIVYFRAAGNDSNQRRPAGAQGGR